MKWCIWYDDGSTFHSGQGSWEDAPVDGVLIVMEYKEDSKLVHMGSDYYLMRDGTIMGVALAHIDRHIRLGIEKDAAKFGRWATTEVWERAHEEAFGVKS